MDEMIKKTNMIFATRMIVGIIIWCNYNPRFGSRNRLQEPNALNLGVIFIFFPLTVKEGTTLFREKEKE
jgi:hypothetical protein